MGVATQSFDFLVGDAINYKQPHLWARAMSWCSSWYLLISFIQDHTSIASVFGTSHIFKYSRQNLVAPEGIPKHTKPFWDVHMCTFNMLVSQCKNTLFSTPGCWQIRIPTTAYHRISPYKPSRLRLPKLIKKLVEIILAYLHYWFLLLLSLFRNQQVSSSFQGSTFPKPIQTTAKPRWNRCQYFPLTDFPVELRLFTVHSEPYFPPLTTINHVDQPASWPPLTTAIRIVGHIRDSPSPSTDSPQVQLDAQEGPQSKLCRGDQLLRVRQPQWRAAAAMLNQVTTQLWCCSGGKRNF